MEEEKQIILNRAKCLLCNDVIISYHVHDYRQCKCGNLSVDGGTFYIKRGFQKTEDYEDMNLYDDSPFEIIRENLHWGTRGKSGKEPVRFVPMCEMSDVHLASILRNPIEGAHWVRNMFVRELTYRKENEIIIKD